MCDVNVYVLKDGQEELYLENVDTIKHEQGKVSLKNLFGEQKEIEADIREIALLKHRIVLEKK